MVSAGTRHTLPGTEFVPLLARSQHNAQLTIIFPWGGFDYCARFQ